MLLLVKQFFNTLPAEVNCPISPAGVRLLRIL